MLVGLALTIVQPKGGGSPAPEPEYDFAVATSGDEQPGVEAVSGETGYIAVSGDARE